MKYECCAWNYFSNKYFFLKNIIEFHERVTSASIITYIAFYRVVEGIDAYQTRNRQVSFGSHAPSPEDPIAPSFPR